MPLPGGSLCTLLCQTLARPHFQFGQNCKFVESLRARGGGDIVKISVDQ
jgi:hypothetical protein